MPGMPRLVLGDRPPARPGSFATAMGKPCGRGHKDMGATNHFRHCGTSPLPAEPTPVRSPANHITRLGNLEEHLIGVLKPATNHTGIRWHLLRCHSRHRYPSADIGISSRPKPCSGTANRLCRGLVSRYDGVKPRVLEGLPLLEAPHVQRLQEPHIRARRGFSRSTFHGVHPPKE